MHKRLFIPGPTETPVEVLLQQAKFLIGHRSSDYTALYDSILTKLHKYFDTKQNVTVITASGSLWMDIAPRCLVNKKALACVNGAFSKRMGQAIKACGKEVDILDVPMGKAVKKEMILERLAKGGYDAVMVCHNETSTGVRSDVYDIGAAIKKEHPDVMLVVDAVSSAGGDLLEPDKINSDILFMSSQKCFALPPGLTIGVYSEAAVARARTVPNRGLYTDLVDVHDYYLKKKQNPSTPNVSLMYALDYQLDNMIREGAQGRYARHQAMAKYTQDWAKKHFSMFSEEGHHSVTVSTINNTMNKNIGDLNKELGKRGYQISNGYGDLKEKTFRIGHMGEWDVNEVKSLIWHIEDVWGI